MSGVENYRLQEIFGNPRPTTTDGEVQSMAKELLYRRREAEKNDIYIESLEKQLAPCTCQSGKCWHHDDD